MFAQMMIPHHQQAVQLAAMVPDRSTNPDVIALAAKIAGAFDKHQGGGKSQQTNEAPCGLQSGPAVVEARDHHKAKAVQEGRHGQEHWVGTFGGESHHHVSACNKAQNKQQKWHHACRHHRVFAE
jgi:uncharacterized protein (DUF305 family)